MMNLFNGYSNFQTFAVCHALLDPDSPVRNLARKANSYLEVTQLLRCNGILSTPLGVCWSDPDIDVDEVNMEVFPNCY